MVSHVEMLYNGGWALCAAKPVGPGHEKLIVELLNSLVIVWGSLTAAWFMSLGNLAEPPLLFGERSMA